MPTWAKVVLGSLAVLVLSCGLVFAGGAYWLNSNKDRLKELGERAEREGRAFGEKADAEGCVTEALKQLDAHPGLMNEVEHRLFLKACLKATQLPADYCQQVPKRGDILKSAAWAISQCKARAHEGSQECGRLMQGIQEACE